MRMFRVLATVVAATALALPQQANAVNSLAFSWVVDCASSSGTSSASIAGTTLPSGTYVVTAEGACTFGINNTHSYPVGTCTSPLPSPCVSTGVTVNGLPGATCIVGVGPVYHQTCGPTGVDVPGCGAAFTVVVNNQCLGVANTAGLISHGGGAMNARVVDFPGYYYDNVGYFVVTAVWTPL